MPPARVNQLVLDPRAFPLVRPQVTWIDGEVYFGSYPVARVTTVETGFLAMCDGTRRLSDAVQAAGVDARCAARVASWLLWWDAELADTREPAGSIERLVLSARHVDGWLGMGGRLLAEARQHRTAIVTCFGSLGATRFVQAFPTLTEVTASSRDEAAMAARLAGIDESMWAFPDRDWRASLPSEPEERDTAMVDALRTLILGVLERHRPKEVFAPAALGSSPDGRLLFDTTLSLYGEGMLEGELHLYEDAPATQGYRYVDEFLSRFEGSYLNAREYYVDVSDVFTRKSSLMDVFRCSVDAREQRSWCESAERTATVSGLAAASHAEPFWRVEVEGIG